MTARIRRVLEVEISVRSVFDAPTIASLAREVENARTLGHKALTPALHRPYPATMDTHAVLKQLDSLSVEEAKRLVTDFLHEKQSGEIRS
jgi:hypothetical protein